MTLSTELKLTREPADLSPEMAEALNSFAAEKDVIVPPAVREASHDPFARESSFIFDSPPVVALPSVRPARRRARRVVTVVALLGTAGWGVYVYQSNRPFDLDIIAARASRFTRPSDKAMTPAATPPSEARPADPPPNDPPLVSNQSAVSLEPDQKVMGAAEPESTGTASLVGTVENVSGEWRLDTQVETSDSSLERLNLYYDMTLKQDGDRVAGVGTKVDENEKVTVTLSGTIAGGRLTLNFVERGTQSETRGKFVLLLDEDGALRGRVSSSAAQSSRHVEGRRMSSAQ
jgi:hypothetical protein